jgi:hypothetical protein
LDSGALLVAQ